MVQVGKGGVLAAPLPLQGMLSPPRLLLLRVRTHAAAASRLRHLPGAKENVVPPWRAVRSRLPGPHRGPAPAEEVGGAGGIVAGCRQRRQGEAGGKPGVGRWLGAASGLWAGAARGCSGRGRGAHLDACHD